MKRVWGSLSVVLFCVCIGWAQAAPADAPADKGDVQKLFATLHLSEMMQNVMTASMQQQKQITRDGLKKKMPSMTDEDFKRMDTFMDEFVKSIDLNGMLDDMIPVYQRHLTKQDVDSMLAFLQHANGTEASARAACNDGGRHVGDAAAHAKNDVGSHGQSRTNGQ